MIKVESIIYMRERGRKCVFVWKDDAKLLKNFSCVCLIDIGKRYPPLSCNIAFHAHIFNIYIYIHIYIYIYIYMGKLLLKS